MLKLLGSWEVWSGYKSYCLLREKGRSKGEPLGTSMTLIRIATQKTAAQICSITVVFVCVCMVYVHVYAGIYTCVQAYTLVYVCENTWLGSSSIAFNLTCSHPEPEIYHISAELAIKLLGSACLCSSALRSQACVAIPCFLTRLLGFWILVFLLSCKHSYPLSHLPRPSIVSCWIFLL